MGGLLPDDPALARQHAVSRVLAAGLVDDLTIWEPIARFRQLHVGETLLAWDAVEGWIEAQQPGDTFRPHTYWLSDIPISPEQIERGIATAPEGHTALSLTITVPVPWTDHPYNARSGSIGRLEAKQVQYLIPGVEDPRWAYVKAGSALDVLLDLSERLVPADPHDPHADNTLRPWWTKAQASTFVLTGLAPVVTRYKAIHLDLDPTTPLEQIMAQVAAARLALVGKRARELSPKHLHLAVFSTERPEEPWAMRLEAWNTTYPHWAYPPESRSNFIRDSLTAKRRLLLQEHE